MKNLLTTSAAASRLRFAALLLSTVVLLVAFCCVTMPLASAREMSPTQILQDNLPRAKTLANCTRADLLSALCAAVKKHPAQSAQVVSVAISAHKAPAADVVGQAITCLGKRPDCNLVGQYVSAAIAADAGNSSGIVERALMVAPDCRSAVEDATRGGGTTGGGDNATGTGNYTNAGPDVPAAPLGFGGGAGGVNPAESKCTVCHNANNPHEINIPCSQVPKYLANHPGDYSGACQATRVLNQ